MLPNPVTDAAKTALVIYFVTLSIAVVSWSAFAFPVLGVEWFWLAPLGVLFVAAKPFAAGAAIYAAIRSIAPVDRSTIDRPAVVGITIFTSLGLGALAIDPFVSNRFLPLSPLGAATGAVVAIAVAILARRGHIHHDSE